MNRKSVLDLLGAVAVVLVGLVVGSLLLWVFMTTIIEEVDRLSMERPTPAEMEQRRAIVARWQSVEVVDKSRKPAFLAVSKCLAID